MSQAKRKSRVQKPYHHGDLRAALLDAAETVLRRDGLVGLGLRAVTREAGVSHTAAKPHFGDLDGLRAELAAVGYRRLAAALEETAKHATERVRRVALARTYVHFAYHHTALFNLMFRHELVDMRHAALVEASALAMRALAGHYSEASSDQLSREGAIRITAGWAYVHGLAMLLVEKRLRGVLKRAPAFSDLMQLVEAVLDSVSIGVEK